MISITQVNDVYQIRFKYDTEFLDIVRSVPGRQWHSDEKFWSIPVNKLGFLLARVKNTKYETDIHIYSEEDIDVNQSLDVTVSDEFKNEDISDFKFRIQKGCKPFAHQLDSIRYHQYRINRKLTSGFILADKPGAGKTASCINIAIYEHEKHNMKHCLIVCCVNGAKYNWKDDIEKHTNGEYEGYILGSRLKRDKVSVNLVGSGSQKLEDLNSNTKYGQKGVERLPFFLITNIEAIRTKEGKKYSFTEKIIEMINSGEIGMIALDEIHKNASPQSAQGKQILKLKKKANKNCYYIPITGTPIINKPIDVFLPLRLVDGHYEDSYYKWCQRFCVYGGFGNHEIIHYKNIGELKEMLQPNMLRRKTEDILDLPPKIRHIEYVENTDYQKRLYMQVANDLLKHSNEISQSPNPLSMLIHLRQVNGCPELVDENLIFDSSYLSKNAKMRRCVELVDEILEENEKVVIFSNWVEHLRTLYKILRAKKIKTCVYTGTMKEIEREQNKFLFQNNPDYKVIIGTIGAMGTTHTLTAGTNMIFLDEPWNEGTLEQAEDRIYRAGTTRSVNIYSLIVKDTVDERVRNIILQKGSTSNFIVDNKLDFKNDPDLLRRLIL